MRLIDADKLSADMYHEAFEKDSDMQKWDSGCWIRYKMFENVLKAQPTVEPEVISKWKKEFREYVDSLDIARDDWKGIIEYIDELPSAEPDTTTHDSIPAKTGENDGDRTSGDCISRQQAIDELNDEYHGTISDESMKIYQIIKWLNELPSVQPEQRWIPVSESMPEEHEWIGTKRFGTTISDEVYVTFEAPDGQRFADHISFQNGKLSRSDEHRMKVVFKGAKPIAWMPLPEPYQEGGEQDG